MGSIKIDYLYNNTSLFYVRNSDESKHVRSPTTSNPKHRMKFPGSSKQVTVTVLNDLKDVLMPLTKEEGGAIDVPIAAFECRGCVISAVMETPTTPTHRYSVELRTLIGPPRSSRCLPHHRGPSQDLSASQFKLTTACVCVCVSDDVIPVKGASL